MFGDEFSKSIDPTSGRCTRLALSILHATLDKNRISRACEAFYDTLTVEREGRHTPAFPEK
jgi:hypothetical protein